VTLPKLIRPDFKHDRTLLTDLSRWTYEALHELMRGRHVAQRPPEWSASTLRSAAGAILCAGEPGARRQ